MMRQQINLYQGALIDKPEPFQSRLAMLILAATVGCLILFGAFDYWQMSKQLKYRNLLRQQYEVATARVAKLEKQYPVQQPSELLAATVERLEQEVKGNRLALEFFSSHKKGGNGAILGVLENLSRHRTAGVWLREINLAHGGQEVQLAGSSVKPEQVPEYLQLLGAENVFSGQLFSHLQLSRLEDNGGIVDFILESTAGVSK